MPIIEVTSLAKEFRTRGAVVHALADVSFSVEEGRFVTLVGPSGCGKSTLLQILAGLISATRGEVRIAGEPIRAPMPDKIGMVFQDPTLLPWKTALANVEFPLDLRGMDRATRRKRCSQLLDLVGLGEFADNYPHELSGGMRQRVAIARGLAPDPRLMLMDEPFAALDAQTRDLMQVELLQIWQQARKTVLFVTHQIEEAVYLSDRVMVMTKRPGQAKKLFDIPLPRPRDYEMRVTPQFNDLKLAIWQTLKDEISV